MFPYWLLAEVGEEKLKQLVDQSYECVHGVKLTKQTRRRYKQYKDKIVEILNKEAETTDKILDKYQLKYTIDITKQKGFEKVLNKIKQLEKKFSSIELQKKIDEVKISFAIDLPDKSRYKNLAKTIIEDIKSNNLEDTSATLEDLNSIESIKRT